MKSLFHLHKNCYGLGYPEILTASTRGNPVIVPFGMSDFGMIGRKIIQAEGQPAKRLKPPPNDRRKNGLPKVSRKLKRKTS